MEDGSNKGIVYLAFPDNNNFTEDENQKNSLCRSRNSKKIF